MGWWVGRGVVGMGGFEPPTSRTLSECANRAALHPELSLFSPRRYLLFSGECRQKYIPLQGSSFIE